MPTTAATRTDPKLWTRVVAKVKRGGKGGEPGEWSARKAQLATAEYKRARGGYRGKKDSGNHLARWTAEKWGTKSGARSKDTGERYLPKAARDSLSDKEHAETTAKKRADRAKGKRFSPQPPAAREKAAAARKIPSARLAFREAVNMPPGALERHLETKRSQEVGFKRPRARESVGHEMGARIAELLRRKDTEAFSKDNLAAMRKVAGCVKRHLAQQPGGDVSTTNWPVSLMNWGHDPLG